MWTYLELLARIIKNGEDRSDRTGVGTRSVFGEQLRIDLRNGFPLLTTKKVPFRWVAEELFWFLSGSTNEHDLAAKGVDIWKEWATLEQCAKFGREAGDLGPVYGYLWRNFGDEVDQVSHLLDQIRTNPTSRRLIVTGWDPLTCDYVALPPCHTLWQCYCHEDGGLSLSLYARSIDAFLGLPFNIASYALLTHLICHCTDKTPRHLVISFGDLHIYKNHMDQVHEQIYRTPYKLPKLTIDGPKDLFDIRFEHLKLEGYEHHPAIKAEVAV